MVAAGLLHDLRNGGRVAEDVGDPEVFDVDPELVHVEVFAVDELADQRLAAGHVAVGLDPHAALALPLAVGDGLLHPLVKLRVMILDELVVLGLGRAEDVAGITVNQIQLAGEGAAAFANALTHRPEPAGIDVRVADGVAGKRRGIGSPGELGAQGVVGPGDVVRVLGVNVDRLVEYPENPREADRVFIDNLEEVPQQVEVDLKVADRLVEYTEANPVDRAGVGAVALGVVRLGVVNLLDTEKLVGRGLDPEFDLFATVARLTDDGRAATELLVENRSVGQPLQGDAVGRKKHRLAVEVEFGDHLLALPRLRHRARQVKPGALPLFAPVIPFFDRLVVPILPLIERHRIHAVAVTGLQYHVIPEHLPLDAVVELVDSGPELFDLLGVHGGSGGRGYALIGPTV